MFFCVLFICATHKSSHFIWQMALPTRTTWSIDFTGCVVKMFRLGRGCDFEEELYCVLFVQEVEAVVLVAVGVEDIVGG